MADTKHSEQAAYGVDELIARLRQQGIDAGLEEGQARLAEAEAKAQQMIQAAKDQAEQIVANANKEAQHIRQGGHEALAIAMRDIILKLKAKLADTVGEKVQHLLAHQLDQEAFLQKLILEVAGRARRDAKLDDQSEMIVLLPESLIGLDDLRNNPLELKEGTLSHFILSVAADVLRDGVEFAQAGQGSSGIVIYLKDQDVQIDLTDERLTQVLLEHLQPRFRAILEGMVK